MRDTKPFSQELYDKFYAANKASHALEGAIWQELAIGTFVIFKWNGRRLKGEITNRCGQEVNVKTSSTGKTRWMHFTQIKEIIKPKDTDHAS